MSFPRLWGAVSLWFAAMSVAGAQHAEPERALQDRLVVKLVQEYPAPASPYSDELVTTGDASLDALLDAEGVDTVSRVFRRPPRGWGNEAAARAVGLGRWVALRWDADVADLERVRQAIESHGAVERADAEVEGTVADTIPDDPDQGQQWAWANDRIRAYKAWDLVTASDHVVAVIDTGTDLDHDDLVANKWKNSGEVKGDGIDNDNNGYIDDVFGWDFYYDDSRPNDKFGHGVHCQGTVSADTNNGLQVAGTAWAVDVMSVKIFSDGGAGTHAISAAGMVYAADNGASVFSMSWGFFDDFQVLEDAVEYCASLDVCQVAAAHNFGSQTRMYPAAYEEVMGIIATDESDRKTSWSNYGSWCSMAAPGNNILSTYLNNGTAYLSGTSMSTPHVAGAAALVRGVNPGFDRLDTQMCLEYSAEDLGGAGFDRNFGWGRLDLFAAVQRAQSLKASVTELNPGESVDIALDFPNEPGFIHIVLPGRNGTAPGFSLDILDPNDHRQVPLNEDSMLFDFIVQHPTGLGVFVEFVDLLDGAGRNTATFNVPGGNLFAGETFGFVALTFDPNDLSKVSSVSCSNGVMVR